MSMPGAYAAGDGGPFSECEGCGAQVRGTPEYDSYGHPMPVLCDECEEKERRAWDADERDMSRIAREWAEYDRDKPDLPLEPTAAELTGPYAVLANITLDYGGPPLQQALQTDAEAANSATPNTDRLPAWNDDGWDAYLYAVDLDYRVDWDLSHGVPRDEVRAMIDDWEESHESDDEEEE